MKTKILAVVLAANFMVLTVATDAQAFGGPIERAVIRAVQNMIQNRRNRGPRRVRLFRSAQTQVANPNLWV